MLSIDMNPSKPLILFSLLIVHYILIISNIVVRIILKSRKDSVQALWYNLFDQVFILA